MEHIFSPGAPPVPGSVCLYRAIKVVGEWSGDKGKRHKARNSAINNVSPQAEEAGGAGVRPAIDAASRRPPLLRVKQSYPEGGRGRVGG